MPGIFANKGLDGYEYYWYTARGFGKEEARERQRKIRASLSGTWGKAGDPLGSQTPLAQNKMINSLADMAAGRINDWPSILDPTLTYGENKRLFLENGARMLPSDRRRMRENAIKSADDQQRGHARDALMDNVEVIDNGQKQQLVEDIEAEFGAEFVAGVLEEARAELAQPVNADPITANTASNETASEPADTSEPIEFESVEFRADKSRPIRVSEPVEPAGPEPAESEPVTTETVNPANYSTGRLFVAYQVAKVRNAADRGISEFVWDFLATALAGEPESGEPARSSPEQAQATLEVY